jgi:hypothetical protein
VVSRLAAKGADAMIDPDADALHARFEAFSQRLRARIAEFQQLGELSDIHRSLLQQIQQRHDQLATKLAYAKESGDKAGLLKAECARDFNGLLDEFLLMEERLDADAMKAARR